MLLPETDNANRCWMAGVAFGTSAQTIRPSVCGQNQSLRVELMNSAEGFGTPDSQLSTSLPLSSYSMSGYMLTFVVAFDAYTTRLHAR
jgi:hypothetical protein